MSRKGNVSALIVFIIVSLVLVIDSLINAHYDKTLLFTGFILMLAGLLAKEYQHKLAPKLENTGVVIMLLGACYWLYLFFFAS